MTHRSVGRLCLAVTALAIVGAVAGCGGAAQHWQRIDLGDVVPDAITGAAPDLLIAGHRGAGQTTRPALLTVGPGGEIREVPLHDRTPYGRIAQPSAVASWRGGIEMLAAARGGAHGNQRWTVWSGSSDAVDEHEQVFWVFGGHEAGTMVAQVATTEGPVVVGGWAGKHGMDVALWKGTGPGGGASQIWERLPSDSTALASSATSQFSAHGAAASGAAIVVAGETLELQPSLHRRPVAWTRPTRDAMVQRISLPAKDSGHADSVACDDRNCWIGGVVGGRAALWLLPGDLRGDPIVIELPGTTVDADTTAVAVAGDRRSASGLPAGLLVRSHGKVIWLLPGSVSEGPVGTPLTASRDNDGVAVVANGPSGRELWRVRG